MGEFHLVWNDKTREIRTRYCIHSKKHKYKMKYLTGYDLCIRGDPLISVYVLCQLCHDKPHFSNSENMVSSEEIKK